MEQADIQRQAAEGWVVYANGQREQALEMLRGAADRESKTEKHVVTPGPLAPAREQLAEMLMEMGRPADALRQFEAVQVTEPNRFRAIYGSARAAEMTGNHDTAKRYYARLIEIAANADTARPELEGAKSYLANN
jgi:tetratricopeptide (TPR) repeat protein